MWANVAPDVNRLEERDDIGMALTREQEESLLAACLSSRSRLLHPAVTVALYTGLRRAELLKLRWGQIDFANETPKVGASKTKAGKRRVVPLNGRALSALTAWAEQFPDRAPEHAVFPSERVGAGGRTRRGKDPAAMQARVIETDPTTPVGSLKESWESARAVVAKTDAALAKVRWHDLRHSCCTRLLERGVSLPMVAAIMGWSPSTTVRMAQRYGHIGDTAKREALAMLDPVLPPPPSSQETDEANAPASPERVH